MIRDLKGEMLTIESLPPVRLFAWKPGPVTSAVVSAMISITPAAAPSANAQANPAYTQNRSGLDAQRSTPSGLTSSITGIVSNDNGEALSGAVITLTSEASGEVLSQLTSDQGEFRFDGLDARTYVVEIRAQGYELARHSELILQQGEARRLDMVMEKLIIRSGVTYIPPQPLRALYLNSDRVVVASVGKSTDVRRERHARLVKTSLNVSQTIKGDGHKSIIDVYQWVYGSDRGKLAEGEHVLAFLQVDEEAAKNTYQLTSAGESSKNLSTSDLEIYIQRLEELKGIVSKASSQPEDIAEWLVQCAENPVTRREGVFELITSARREKYQEQEPVESVDSQIGRPREPRYSTLLTSEQKQRLMEALFKSHDLNIDGDFDLIELATQWNEPRLLRFLMDYLHRSKETVPLQVSQVMDAVAELLADEKLSALSERYRDNASYEDLEVKEDDAAIEESDEDEVADPDEEDIESETENTDEDEEVNDPPPPTPEAAKQARVEMLTRFIEAAEAHIKRLSAK